MDVYDLITDIMFSAEDEEENGLLSEVVNILEGDTLDLGVISEAMFHITAYSKPDHAYAQSAFQTLRRWESLVQIKNHYQNA